METIHNTPKTMITEEMIPALFIGKTGWKPSDMHPETSGQGYCHKSNMADI
jgi:hypothetical protein